MPPVRISRPSNRSISIPCRSGYADAKFGIFIHYGVFSVPGFAGLGCWYGNGMYTKDSPTWKFHRETYGPQDKFGYKDLVPLLTADKWNPDEWVSLFKEAGARFVVPVCCFHDGYAMWDSKLTDWNVVKTGPKRDYDGLLAAAARKQGLNFGVAWHRFFQVGFFGPAVTSPIRTCTRRIPARRGRCMARTVSHGISWTIPSAGSWS